MNASWWFDQIEVVLAIGAAVWGAAIMLGRLSNKVEDGFALNHEDHEKIILKLDDHSERLAKVEVKVEDHKARYP